MWQSLLDITHISSLKIHGTSAGSSGKNGHFSRAGYVVLPFVGVGVPVQLAYSSRMDCHDGRCYRRRHFEAAGIDDAHFPSPSALGNRLLGFAKGEILFGETERTRGCFLIGLQ